MWACLVVGFDTPSSRRRRFFKEAFLVLVLDTDRFGQGSGSGTKTRGIMEHDKSELSFLQRFSIRDEFLAELHASVYALVLGIADDVMANAEITLLSDKIVLDVVPRTQKEAEGDELKQENFKTTNGIEEEENRGGAGFHTPSFLLGCGLGIASVAVALAAGSNGSH